MKKFIIVCLLAGCMSSLTVSAQQKMTEKELEEVFQLMSGSFSNQAQAHSDTAFFDIRLHSKPMWQEKNEHWLYIELAMAGKVQEPYRQRVYSFSLFDDSTIACKVYSIKGDAKKYAGEWKKNQPLEGISPGDLEARDGCTIYFHHIGRGIYDGGTVANSCANAMKGAAYATSVTHLDKVSMMTWDRGYDSSGRQVWGTTKGYDFKKDH